MAVLIDGKAVSEKIREDISKEVLAFSEESGITPGLAVIIVGEDPASQVYVRNKKRGCKKCGMKSFGYELPKETTQAELLALIDELNKNDEVHGILVQLPLPKHIDENTVLLAIDPKKDVDAFHPVNVGKIMTGDFDFVPCTPAGVMALMDAYGVDVSGKDCVVIGRSNIVGKPQAMLLLHKNGTVTVCHSRTQGLKEKCASADILVAAIGKPNFVTADMVKDGAVVMDVGINRITDSEGNEKLVGDVDFASVSEKASYITPVPGGVGPMTITMLLRNTLTAAKRAAERRK